MPNFDSSVWVKAQSKLTGAFQATEMRSRNASVHQLFMRNTNIMMPNYEVLRTHDTRVLDTHFINRTPRALGSTISHTHNGTQGDSSVLTPTWFRKEDKIVSTVKEADRSIYDLTDLQISKFNNSMINFSEGLEADASSYLFTNRTGVNNADGVEGSFANNTTFEITDTTAGERAIQITKMAMDINKYTDLNYTIVCDSIAWNRFRFDNAQGAGNDTNTAFQFDGLEFILDVNLTAPAQALGYTKGYWIAVPTGTIAGLDWIPPLYRRGMDNKENSYGSVFNPLIGMQLGGHTYEERVDGTSLGGNVQDLKIETQFHTDLAYVHAPLSVANETTIFGFALV
jgi:hypothetical protein